MDSAKMGMTPVAGVDEMLHEQLLERRDRLSAATMLAGGDLEFASLLGEVDAALERVNAGTFGICEVCHEPVEPERLLADPLVRVCLGDLSEKQRRTLEDDLQLAAEIQTALLPRTESSSDFWSVDFVYKPAGIVSGDYVDVIPHNGELYFILGDVSGKGMAASLLMSNLHAMFHSLVPLGMPLDELMSRANRLFCESTLANHYATLICGKLNKYGEVEMSNAGHLPPILVKNGENTLIDAAGLPLGMFCDSNFAPVCLKLTAGEGLLLYTDGVTEATDGTGKEYAFERLLDSVKNGYEHEPSKIVRGCLEAVEAFRGMPVRTDDLTLLAVKFGGMIV